MDAAQRLSVQLKQSVAHPRWLPDHLRIVFAIAACLGFPAILFLTARVTLFQVGTLDPFVYAGYAHDYSGTLARYGLTYYSTRVAYIYPEYLFYSLFGLETGYYALRFTVVVAASVAVYAIARRFYSNATAILTVGWLCLTPWFPRSLFWTHYDGFAIAYMLIGTALIVIPERRFIVANIGAGIAFALSVNCNLVMLIVCGLLGPGWAFFHWHRGGAWFARAIGGLVAGFLGAYLALALALQLAFPGFDFLFETAAVRESLSLMTGQAANWFVPFSAIFNQLRAYGILLPFLFLIVAVIVSQGRTRMIPTERRRLAVFACSYLAGMSCFALIFHFGFHGGWFSILHYTAFFLPGCVLAFILIVGETAYQGGRFWGPSVIYAAIALIIVAWFVRPKLSNVELATHLWLWLAVAASGIAAALAMRWTRLASPVMISCVAMFALSFYQANGNYEVQILPSKDNQKVEWDVYRGAVFLQDFVNANIRPTQSVGFWYSNEDGDHGLDSIQSTHLWAYSRLFSKSAGRQGMPVVDDDFRSKVPGRDFIVLLGLNDSSTETGRAALEAGNFGPKEIARTRFQGDVWGYSAMILSLKKSQPVLGMLLRKRHDHLILRTESGLRQTLVNRS